MSPGLLPGPIFFFIVNFLASTLATRSPLPGIDPLWLDFPPNFLLRPPRQCPVPRPARMEMSLVERAPTLAIASPSPYPYARRTPHLSPIRRPGGRPRAFPRHALPLPRGPPTFSASLLVEACLMGRCLTTHHSSVLHGSHALSKHIVITLLFAAVPTCANVLPWMREECRSTAIETILPRRPTMVVFIGGSRTPNRGAGLSRFL